MREGGGRGQKIYVFVITLHAGGGGGVKKWQKSVHVVVECPLTLCGWCCKAKHHSVSQCLLLVFTIFLRASEVYSSN